MVLAALQNDTGTDNADGLTFDPKIVGIVADESPVTLQAQVNAGVPMDVSVDAGGNFSFDPGLATGSIPGILFLFFWAVG